MKCVTYNLVSASSKRMLSKDLMLTLVEIPIQNKYMSSRRLPEQLKVLFSQLATLETYDAAFLACPASPIDMS